MTEDTTTTATATTITPVKPGIRSTEFWLTLAAKALGILFATGVLGNGTTAMRIAGVAAAILGVLGYTVSRAVVKAAGVLIVVGMLASTQTACTHNTRTETLQAAQLSVGAARDSLATYDQLEQDQIVLAATSLDGGKAQLVSWRHKRTQLVTAIATAYRAIAIAGQLNDQPSLGAALTAAGEVVDAIKAIVTMESQ